MLASRHRGAGFSLLEMCIVLAIISIIAAGAIAYLTVSMERRGVRETERKLAIIQETLMNYRLAFNRIPCPAQLTDAVNTTVFGQELDPATGCAGLEEGFSNSGIKFGMLPTKTLNLPDDFAFDGWGRRFTYVMFNGFALDNAFITNTADAVVAGMMEAFDTSGNRKAEYVIYGVISHGRNGHGAYPRSGTGRLSSGSSNTFELANCACDSNGSGIGIGNFGEDIYQGLPWGDMASTNYYDDMVIYETRASMRSNAE